MSLKRCSELRVQQSARSHPLMMGISPAVVIDGEAHWADAVPPELLDRLSSVDRVRVGRIAAAIGRARAAEAVRAPGRSSGQTLPGT